MKLESLHIKNYKLFRDLEIPRLGRVNLITGKNNTGKTILLEALRIWASEGEPSIVNNIIWNRGDWKENSDLETYSSLFNPSISMRNAQERVLSINDISLIAISEDIVKYLDSFIVTKSEYQDRKIRTREVNEIKMNYGNRDIPNEVALFVPASTEFNNSKLWSEIELTEKEDWVVDILQIIEPKIEAVGIIEGKARVRTKDSKTPVPLKNFGEGLNRLLTIAMALVSAEDNLLLIDEIDTGLHYTVLEKLWEIIFEYAEKLDVQVFVTTHSGDCVDAFSTIANQERFKSLGNYFRLSRKDDGIVAVDYGIEELEMALESNIETR